jgi:hypothetical protein
MTLDDQKDFLDFLALGAAKNHFNLSNLTKLFDILAKLTYSAQKEEMRKEKKAGEALTIEDESYKRFCCNLRKKLAMVFSSGNELLTFFDLSATETLRIDEFLFGI